MGTDTDNTKARAALFVATLSSFIGPFMSSSVNVALPAIGREFSMGAVSLGWINTAFLLSAAALLIPLGHLGDLYGKKRLFVGGTLLLAISSIFLANSSSAAMIILCRVGQGIASSMVFATALPILISVVPPNQRGKSIGITIAAVYIGLSIGPFVGGFITQELGWRFIFWLNVPVGIALLAIAGLKLPDDHSTESHIKFDVQGSIILGLSLLSAMYGFSNLPSYQGGILTTVGLLGMWLFVRFEQKSTHPVLDIGLFKNNPVFAFSNLAALINYAATFAVSFLLSLYLQNVRGLSPRNAGIVLITQPIVQALFSPFAGKRSDKIEPRILASIGMAIICAGLAVLAFLTATWPMAAIITCLAILGFGFAMFSSPNTNAIMGSVDRHSLGIAGATVSAARQIGMMFSMGIVMMAMGLVLGKEEIRASNYDLFLFSVRLSFALFAILCFGGIFASLARGNIRAAKVSPE